MAALVCDVCDGKLVMGSGGVAVCENCGMEHTKERMREKVQEIKGTVTSKKKMKNCVACNALLEEDAKFCSECRAKQPERQVELEEQEAKTAEEYSKKAVEVVGSLQMQFVCEDCGCKWTIKSMKTT